jgi:hypothetical protein
MQLLHKTFKTLQKQYLQKIKYWNIDAWEK